MAGISVFRSDDARVAYLQLYDAVLATSEIPVTEADVETSFGRTHVLRAGDPSKPPLVALHGSSISSTMWVPNLPVLTANHSVTMIDAIDEVGKSIQAKPTSKITDLVAWLDETLCALEIQRSAVVAASRGTWMATHYATAFPERVERLALVCPVGIVSGMSPRFLIRGLTAIAVWPTERRVWSLLDSLVRPGNRGLLRQNPWRPIYQQFVGGTKHFKMSLGNAEPRPWPLTSDCDLRRVAAAQIPVLAIIGREESAQNGPKTAIRFRRELPEARIELVNDAGHGILQDQPEIVDGLLAEFLQEPAGVP
ncbi:alpha/beta fold hydrolase [Mycobacterium sp. SMC-11]|uniref:alpha/beta fold hydrolase n=1 Tax=Mycobacterium sp. SMC-11 TaxID=3385969 RepID=UPI00390CA330